MASSYQCADMVNSFRNLDLTQPAGCPDPMESIRNSAPKFSSDHHLSAKTAFVPAICNFQTARKMAQENLEHQPLPDAVIDIAFRKAQVAGSANPGAALDVGPFATGVGCKNYKAGPTKCTKYRVYRPKTCGVIPKVCDDQMLPVRPDSFNVKKRAGAMDLAIGWDFATKREPRSNTFMDGSKPSVAPPIFEVVEPAKDLNLPMVVHSGGVFSNTMGEENFFDRDVVRQYEHMSKTLAQQKRCKCGVNGGSARSQQKKPLKTPPKQHQQQDQQQQQHQDQQQHSQQHPSSAKLSNAGSGGSAGRNASRHMSKQHDQQQQQQLALVKNGGNDEANVPYGGAKSEQKLPNGYKHEAIKLEPLLGPDFAGGFPYNFHQEYRCALNVAMPPGKAPYGMLPDGHCGVDHNRPRPGKNRALLHIPKPREPFTKKNYVIDTLAPPFAFWKKGSGYPDYWRLISVYQQAYNKPLEKRKYPLLKTVYQ